MSINRINALFILFFAVMLYGVVIPRYVEQPLFDGGLSPDTVPNFIALMMGVFAVVQFMERDNATAPAPLPYRPMGLGAMALMGAWFMGIYGFLPVALVLGALVISIAGERRWVVMGVGLALICGIWYGVDTLLDRPLP